MKVLVTGANSLLGANVIAELLQNGYSVRGMVRMSRKIPISHPGLEAYTGEITCKDDVLHAAEGCQVIIHIAANTDQHSGRYNDYAAVNVNGTLHVLEAAKKNLIKRVILVSSANTIGYGSATNPGTEENDFRPPFTGSCYARSKHEAQVKALMFTSDSMGDIIVVNPTFMIGKYDTKPSSGTIIIRGYKKKIVFVPPGGKNFIHVKDVAGVICSAIHHGRNKACYLLAHENMSYKDFYTKLNEVTGNKSMIVTIPKTALLFAGMIGTCLRLFGIKTALHYNNMRILCIKNYYSNRKAREELMLKTTPVTEAISDAVEWFRESGMLKR